MSIRQFMIGKVYFDPTKVNICCNDSKVYIYRSRNQRFNPKYNVDTVKHDGDNIIV